MNSLTPVTAPADFEQRLLVRTALSALPPASAPDDFEAALLRRLADQPTPTAPVHGFRAWPWVIGAVAILGLSLAGFVASRPTVVAVHHVPVLAGGGADLHHLAPVPVTEDQRFPAVTKRPTALLRQRRGDGIVAGYPTPPGKRP